MSKTIQMEPGLIGSDIRNEIERAIALSTQTNRDVKFSLNSVRLTVESNNIKPVDYYYNQYLPPDRVVEEYPIAEKLEAAQAGYYEHALSLGNLDFDKLSDVLDWWVKYESFCIRGIDYTMTSTILAMFKVNGYYPGMCVGPEYNMNSKTDFASYIVGQCLAFMAKYNGLVHQIVHTHVKEWHDKFDLKATP